VDEWRPTCWKSGVRVFWAPRENSQFGVAKAMQKGPVTRIRRGTPCSPLGALRGGGGGEQNAFVRKAIGLAGWEAGETAGENLTGQGMLGYSHQPARKIHSGLLSASYLTTPIPSIKRKGILQQAGEVIRKKVSPPKGKVARDLGHDMSGKLRVQTDGLPQAWYGYFKSRQENIHRGGSARQLSKQGRKLSYPAERGIGTPS